MRRGTGVTGCRMTRIHDLLLREGFEGSYDAVRRCARRWADGRRKDLGGDVPAFISLLFKPGEAYQFAWSHEDVEIAGKPIRVKVAHMRFCASWVVYVRAYGRRDPVRCRGQRFIPVAPRVGHARPGCCSVSANRHMATLVVQSRLRPSAWQNGNDANIVLDLAHSA